MNEKLQQQLFDAFPRLFRARGRPPKRLDGYGICTGDGWYSLIYELCAEIQKHADANGVDLIVLQVKEKFGGLRFYLRGADEVVDAAVDKAERLSFHTCEVCGAQGERRYHAWVQTLCDKHDEEYIREHGDDCDDEEDSSEGDS